MKKPISRRSRKGRIATIQVRVTSSELKAMAELAEADKRTLSDWVRKILSAAVEFERGAQQL